LEIAVKIIRRKDNVKIDAGIAGVLEGNNILIRHIANMLERDGKNHQVKTNKDGTEATFNHGLDGYTRMYGGERKPTLKYG